MTGWRFLILSLFVHLVLWLIILSRPPLPAFVTQTDKSVDVTIVTKKETEKARVDMAHKTIVRQALPPLDMLKPEPPKDPKYLSEKDQNVTKEMQSKNPGLTENRPTELAETQPAQEGGSKGGVPLNPQAEPGFGIPAGPSARPNDNALIQLGRRLFAQQSTSGEYLPDVAEGPITALNSERFIYYSFFARIEERIRPIWERNVRDTQLRLPLSVQRQVMNHNWITGLEILIDDKGNYQATFVKDSCGVDEIDRAAIQSFSEAAYFPNPPKGMIEKDGRIHLKYSFIVIGSSSAWAGNGAN